MGLGAVLIAAFQFPPHAIAKERDAAFSELGLEYDGKIRSLMERYCLACHGSEDAESELDLQRFKSFAIVRQDPNAWTRVVEMLDSGEMPPAASRQPSETERKTIRDWVDRYLAVEALSRAGDPGPVQLRRLSNDEYNYAVQDLTKIETLRPTREFPVDGAAGEGFTNTGSAQAMSPAMVQKYIDAGKEVAEHVVLTPDGVRFSRHTTTRDRTDALMAEIQGFYRRYTRDGGGQAVNLQGIQFDTNQGGVFPLERYLGATIEARSMLERGEFSEVAAARSLSPKYLRMLYQRLATPKEDSFLMNDLQRRWKAATPKDVESLTAWVAARQTKLWKYNVIGHIGPDANPGKWLEPAFPIEASQSFELELPNQGDVVVTLSAMDARDDGEEPPNQRDGSTTASVVWENARLTGGNQPDVPLRDVAGIHDHVTRLQKTALLRTVDCLAACDEAIGTKELSPRELKRIAQKHRVEADTLESWLRFLSVRARKPASINGHFKTPLQPGQFSFIQGWGSPATPSILANTSEKQVRIPGLARPRSVMVHPSPTHYVGIAWRSPMSGRVQVTAAIRDAHPECGNGQQWIVEHRRGGDATSRLGEGQFATGGQSKLAATKTQVRIGDVLVLIVGPKDKNHSCDLTEVEFAIEEIGKDTGEKQRRWSLASDVVSQIAKGNPLPDHHGNPKTWHFFQAEMESLTKPTQQPLDVPDGSLLDRWRHAKDAERKQQLAREVLQLTQSDPPQDKDSPDGVLYQRLQQLAKVHTPLDALIGNVAPDGRFEKQPNKQAAALGAVRIQAPQSVRFQIPAWLAKGRKLTVVGRVADPAKGAGVRLAVGMGESVRPQPALGSPIVVAPGSAADRQLRSSMEEFQHFFPPVLCYARIVPVDEVVTSTLFYRQDEMLRDLMLTDAQQKRLDQLWDELLYVAKEPLQTQVAFEQIRAFATQDRKDLVTKWAPLVEGVEQRAAAFRQRLRRDEPKHVDAVIRWAARAWRRPLRESEQAKFRQLYEQLRQHDGLEHEAAVQRLVARTLASPAFLYRHEKAASTKDGWAPVGHRELATRLSFFLWSTIPDAELTAAASRGELGRDEVLRQTTRRMLSDARARRMAIQFACQWLHIRDFRDVVEKNEELYPEFPSVRDDLHEEGVRFFDDMIRNNRSVLEMLNSKHVFLNERLAKHYGITAEFPTSGAWQRLPAPPDRQGGVLTMGSVLASQSGVSRTSPILRGNWVYETLLGQRLPKPPNDVPVLPEQPPAGLTARQLIEKHSSDAACAKCHAKIDPFGFALEQYDAVGRKRPRPADTKARLATGEAIDGMADLRDYLATTRRDAFVRQFCRKLLGYALGREVLLSDRPLLDKIARELKTHDYRFHAAVETIVLSEPFRSIRADKALAP